MNTVNASHGSIEQGLPAINGLMPALLLALVFIWVAIAAATNTALPHDMAEQFVWAQTWQWGYPKHPPLPTWLFKLLLEVLPVAPWSLYALAALCISGAGALTWLLARELTGSAACATAALSLWTLQQPFSWRAWMFNHNSVMVLCMAGTAYALSKAVSSKRWGWWMAVAVAAGLSMMTKLQSALPLAGLLWVLVRTGQWREPLVRRGTVLVICTICLMMSPYIWWLLHGHGDALAYAKHQLGEGGKSQGDRLLLFLLVNIRMLMLTLIVLLGWCLYARSQRPVVPTDALRSAGSDASLSARAWTEGLFLIPLLGVCAVGVSGGATVPGHWGVQTFQFISVVLVLWFKPWLLRLPMPQAIVPVLVLHVFGMLIAASPAMSRLHAKGTVQGYPAAELARRVEADWRKTTGCELRYVIAPFFEGGQIAAMVKGFPAIFEDADLNKSPWIDVSDMKRRGYMVVSHHPGPWPERAISYPSMSLMPPPSQHEIGPAFWAVVPPEVPCAAN